MVEITEARKIAVHRVTAQLCNMLYNNVINENGTEPFENWCTEQFDEEKPEVKLECEKLLKEVSPIIDKLCFDYLNVGF